MRNMTVLTAGALMAVFVTATFADEKKELEKFQGAWTLASSERDGKAVATGAVREVKGNTYTITAKGKVVGKGTIKLDPSASPKTIDVMREGGKPMLGIYAFDGDAQKVCLAPPGKPRPTAFSSDGGNTLSVWKRAK